jgi:hypothetical protein
MVIQNAANPPKKSPKIAIGHILRAVRAGEGIPAYHSSSPSRSSPRTAESSSGVNPESVAMVEHSFSSEQYGYAGMRAQAVP